MGNIKHLFELLKNHKWDQFENELNNKTTYDLNIKNENGSYLIDYIIMLNKPKLIPIIINKGARIDVVDNEGRSLLYAPIKYDYVEIVETLLLHDNKNIGISILDLQDNNGRIGVHYAIISKNIKIMKLLLESGSNIDIQDSKGNSSLHLSLYTRDIDICKIILSKNPKINMRTFTGETALHIACTLQLYEQSKMLLENGIDINILEKDHEYSVLHYSVTLNDTKLTGLFLDYNINPNVQDYFGNTVLHYCVTDDRLEEFEYIISKTNSRKKSHNILNVNLFNLDGKFPLHIALDTNKSKKYIDLLIENTKINFQDNNNNSCLNLLLKNGIWKDYISILKNKKLNILVNDSDNKRPIDYLNKKDYDDFMNILTKSYFNRLTVKKNKIWKHEWENICKKADKCTQSDVQSLKKYGNNNDFNGKSPIDICEKIIKNNLINQINANKDQCNFSYPVKESYICIRVPTSTKTEFCTFTGSILDILTGLIYILNTHKNVNSVLTSDFIKNPHLRQFYNSQNINVSENEFLNFEIIWAYKSLFFPMGFWNLLKFRSNKKKKRFFVIPLGIEDDGKSHSNYIIYDQILQEVERFEPNGAYPPFQFDYDSSLLDVLLENKFKQYNPTIKYFPPASFLPKIGFQLFDLKEGKFGYLSDPKGFCAVWSIWYTELRLTHPKISRDKLIYKITDQIRKSKTSYRTIIRNYSQNITKYRDIFLSKAKISINQWVNNEYTQQQQELLLHFIKQKITALV